MRIPANYNGKITYWQKFADSKFNFTKLNTGTFAMVGVVSLIGAAFFMIAIQPQMYSEYYKKQQQKTFAQIGLSREERARGLRPWSDPFDHSDEKK